jgi:hypothetical protein
MVVAHHLRMLHITQFGLSAERGPGGTYSTNSAPSRYYACSRAVVKDMNDYSSAFDYEY